MWCSWGFSLWHKTLALGCWRWRFWTFFPLEKSWEFIKVESDEFSFWGQWPMFRGEVLVFRDEMGHVETCGANFHPPKIFFVVDIHLPKMWTRDIFHQGKQKQLHFSSYCSKKVLGRQFISASYVSLNPSLPDFQIKGYINWSTLRGCWIISTKKDIYIYKDSRKGGLDQPSQ